MDWKSKLNRMAPKKQQLLIMMLVGVLLVIIAFPVKEKPKEVFETEQTIPRSPVSDYEEKMEAKLERVLEKTAGVGEAEVMITLKSTAEKVVEKDEERAEDSYREETVYADGQEEQSPYVKKEMTPEIGGIVVIAAGGENPVTVQHITEAVQALFDVDTHKIKIMKMNQKK